LLLNFKLMINKINFVFNFSQKTCIMIINLIFLPSSLIYGLRYSSSILNEFKLA